MSDVSQADIEPPKLPRWAQVAAGAVLLPFCLLTLAGSVALALDPPSKAPILATVLGVVFALICLWILSLVVRLLANRPGRGLLGPFALRVAAVLFVALPIAGIFTDYWRTKPVVAAIQALCYLTASVTSWRLANGRKHAV